jgi:SPASM domain peptide maturase of grasp-with-spasm system
MEKVVKMFSTCQIVYGYTRGAVYDLTRNKYYLVPIEFCDFVRRIDGMKLSEFNKLKEDRQLGEYIDFLKKKEILFFVNETESVCFGEMNFEYDSPSDAHTVVIEMDDTIPFDLPDFLIKTKNTGLENAVFFATQPLPILYIHNILKFFQLTRFQQIEIICRYDTRVEPASYFQLFHSAPRLRKLSLHSAPNDHIYHAGGESARLFTFSESLARYPDPIVDYGYFKINVPFFTEALLSNPFYNKKIFIDATGRLKNAPYSKESFDLVDEINVEEVIKQDRFRVLWQTRKDNIDVCKDCEFRYMCMDSRIPCVGHEGRLYHETDCNYNPYICKWAGEGDYLNLTESGVTVNKNTFELNAEKIREMISSIYDHEP